MLRCMRFRRVSDEGIIMEWLAEMLEYLGSLPVGDEISRV